MKREQFNQYAEYFAAITPACMREVYLQASSEIYGSIVDCGCGPCKLAPHVLKASNFIHYWGVDYSREMVALAQQQITRMADTRFTVQCDSVDNVRGEFDCAVSLQSYYAWPNPVQTLTRIHQFLVPGGKLVLGTANPQLDIEQLIEEARVDWMLHPLWDDYVAHNRELAKDQTGCFGDLDHLIGELRGVGFTILEAHTRFYSGGLNYVVCRK